MSFTLKLKIYNEIFTLFLHHLKLAGKIRKSVIARILNGGKSIWTGWKYSAPSPSPISLPYYVRDEVATPENPWKCSKGAIRYN